MTDSPNPATSSTGTSSTRTSRAGRPRIDLRIDWRGRLPIWTQRALFAATLMFFSEIVMWNNPTARTFPAWVGLAILYVCLSAGLLDLAVRFQARELAPLLLISGAYSLVHAVALNPSSLYSLPISLVVRGMGLQTAAAFYALLFYVTVMRGRPPLAYHVLAALGIGVLWGVWARWYPIQVSVNWPTVDLATAQTIVIFSLVLLGSLFFLIAPRFKVVREDQFSVLWWEAILILIPLLVALVTGIAQGFVPLVGLLIAAAVGAAIAYALFNQRGGYDPSILADMMFAAPNLITFGALALIFTVAGTIAYGLVDSPDSVIGVITYYLVLAFGAAWLPLASLLLAWKSYRSRNADPDADPEGVDTPL